MNLAAKIWKLRRAQGLTLAQLAARSQMPRGHLYHIEAQTFATSLATLEKICSGLNVGLGRFLAMNSHNEIVLEDSFVRQVKPYLAVLNHEQRKHVLKTLAAAPKQTKRRRRS